MKTILGIRRNIYVLVLLGLILLYNVFGVQAATTVEWTNTGSSDYNIAANWAGGTVPQGTGYNPDVTNGGTVMISGSDPTWAVNNLQAGDGSGNSGTFSQSGGTASCDQWLRLGQGSGGTGTYMMSGGTFTDGNGSHGQVNIGEAGSGTFTVSGGTVNLTGTFSGAGGANGGGTGGTGTINLSGAGAISVSGAGNGGPFELGYSGNGMMIQTGGSLTDTKTSSSDSYVWCLGGGTSGTGSSIGIYNMSAGTFGCSNNFWCGGYGNGEMNVSGTASATISGGGSGSSYPAIGRQAGSFGILDISGGTLACTGSHTIQVSQSGTGTLNVRGGTATFNGMQVASSSGGIGIVNINGGTLAISGANNISEAASTGTGTLNFNGGTLQAGGANSTFITGLNNAYIFSGGATIDSQTYAITIPQALKTPSGNGVTGIPVATGGVGYQVPPIVKISSGGGSGATAIATISGGAVTGITIICSGTGYTSAPTVTLTGGGYTTAATIGTVTYGANSSGGLTKIGSGTLTLTAADTYTGSTTVSAGTLALSGSGAINSSSGINVAAGGTFDVSGTGANYTIPGTLTASGTASAATIKGGSGKTVAANSGITLTYDGSDPALTISQGTLSLNGNTFTVNGSVLATGSYNIISQTSGNITGSGSYSVTGTAIPAAGATVSVVGGNVVLQVNSGVSYSGYIITGSGSMTAGGSQTITVSAVDTSGATVTGVSGNIFLTFSGLNSSPDFTAPTVGGTAVGSPVSLSFVSGQATATLQVYDAQSATLAVTDGTHSTISTGGAGLGLIISSGSASTTAVQTAASGGVNVSAQNVSSGSSITVYAVSADAYGNSLGNVAATWSLSTKTGGVANGDLLASGDAKSATLTGHLAGTAVIQAVAGSFTGQSGTLTVIAGSASQTTVETAANGTGSVVGTQNITAGNSITGYAISRDAAGNFVGNVAATWSLQNITGGVANGDLLASGETNNATFTGHLEGTAVIQAVAGGFAGQSGTLTVIAGSGGQPPTNIQVNNLLTNGVFYGVSSSGNGNALGWSSWSGDPLVFYTTNNSTYNDEIDSFCSFGWWDGANMYQDTSLKYQPSTDYVLTARVRDSGSTAIGGVFLELQDATVSPWSMVSSNSLMWSNSANKPGPWFIYSLYVPASTIAAHVGDQIAVAVGIRTNGVTQYGWMDVNWVQLAPAVPVFSVEPQNQTNSAGGAISMSATAIGAVTNSIGGVGSVLQYQWYESPSTMLTSQTNATLILSNLAPGNAGTYYVTATGPFGTGQSSTATITVLGAQTPTLSYSYQGGNFVLTYTGTLRSSATINGIYTVVGGATSPYTVPIQAGSQFYRVSIP